MSSDPSFRKINYALRPTKQVERRLIASVLDRCREVGYDLSKYRYLGFGSVYYADFLLFHRVLRMNDMWCVESENIPLAMEFNKPFEFVTVHMNELASVAPRIEREIPHFAWLDYDRTLEDDVLRDVRQVVSLLAPGSVFVVTVQCRPPLAKLDDESQACFDERQSSRLEMIQSTLGRYRRRRVRPTELTERGFARLYQEVLSSAIDSAISGRSEANLRFYQLFSFRYRDNAPMYTFGGIIDRKKLGNRFVRAGVAELEFVQQDVKADPVEISVPMLTPRERLWLEQNLNSDPRGSGAFELAERHLKNYRRFYREYPTYGEIIA